MSINPDELELAPAAERAQLEGTIWNTATEAELLHGLERAFDYRGDVTLTLKDGSTLEGYVFDRLLGSTFQNSSVRILARVGGEKIRVPLSNIAGLAFTGRDTAAGKSWEAWVTKYWQKESGRRAKYRTNT